MKKLNILICMLGACILTAFSCEKEKVNNSCYENRKTIKTASNVMGRVSVLDSKHPEVWCIKSMEGIIGYEGVTYDSYDVIIPCNLPDNFKIQDLKVLFSGELKDPQRDFKNSPDSIYYSNVYYSKLTEINHLEN